jgi:hypothetical protein
MRSDLMNLPPQTLTQLVWAVLYRSGWTEFTAVGDGAFLMAEDGDGARRVGVVYTSGANAKRMAEFIEHWLEVTQVKKVTSRELFCLARRPPRPERFFPASAADAPLVIHTRSDIDRLFVEGELGGRLLAWRGDKPFIWEILPEPARLRAFVEAELRADQFTKLSASSADKTRRTPLSKVFMDLQIAVNHPEFTGIHHSPPRFVATAQEAMATPQPLRVRPNTHHERYDRLVLMGGPGQGKTTLGVFLCQNLRAALLREQEDLAEETNIILQELTESKVPGPCGYRLPLRVELYRFAERLSSEASGYDLWRWLEEYSLHRPSEGTAISRAIWRQWLTAWPSCIVFDGLDEVPPSANRDLLLSTIKRFVGEIEDAGADIFVVVTTRPQGYRDELRSEGWIHYGLLELPKKDALEYAGLLYSQWHREDSFLRAEVFKRLDRTINERSTAVLAKSPLQVTILCVLIEQLGRAPKDRWRLFREYYRIIFERERERGIESVAILREQQELVERLHAEVGYRLHLADELRGGGGTMPPETLRNLVNELLEEEGHTGEALRSLAEKIIRGALDRLVFLVGHSADKVGFEIRTLQEFFAAERLLRGEERFLEERLAAVATSAHWQNVVLFAVGRIVAERDVLLPGLVRICDQLAQHLGGLGRIAGLGQRLSARILVETGAANRPKVLIPLREIAFAGPESLTRRHREDLLRILEEHESPEIVESLFERALAVPSAIDTVHLLAEAAIAGNKAAAHKMELITNNHNSILQRALWFLIGLNDGFMWERSVDVVSNTAPVFWGRVMAANNGFYFYHQGRRVVTFGRADRAMSQDMYNIVGRKVKFRVLGTSYWSTHISASPADYQGVDLHPYLRNVLEAYYRQPGAIGLAEALKLSGWLWQGGRKILAAYVPWPLEQCLLVPDDEVDEVTRRAAAGELGDLDDWLRAELRWLREGFSPAEFLVPVVPMQPIPKGVASDGVLTFLSLSAIPVEIYDQMPANPEPSHHITLNQRLLSSTFYEFERRIQPDRDWLSKVLRSIEPTSSTWDYLSASSAYPIATFILAQAVRQKDRWDLWLPRIVSICSVAARLGRGPYDPVDDYATELMATHPAQPELVVLIDLLGYRDLDHLKRFTSFACSSLAPDIALRVLIVQSAFVTVESAPHLAEQIAQRSTYLQDTLERVVETLNLHRPPGALELLKGLLRLLPDPKAGYEDLLYNLLTALPSDVQSLETAQRLGLPTEGLHPLAPTAHTTAGAFAQPLWLKQVRLTNLRAWGSGEFNFSPPADGQGQWVFLVGDNGTGKTTVLRAIALSLMQDGVAARVLSQIHGALVKNGAESGEASVTLNDDTTWQVRLQRDGQVERKNGVQDFVVGYGPRRGTILGVTEREMNFAPGEELETLFVEGGNLIHAPSWLKRQDHRSRAPGSHADKELLHAVINVLKRVLPGVDSIEVGPDKIRVRGDRVGDTTIEAMSDGYLTTAGWVVDLMARWLERERVAKHPIPNNFNEIMTAWCCWTRSTCTFIRAGNGLLSSRYAPCSPGSASS